jgi:hypothetical protein
MPQSVMSRSIALTTSSPRSRGFSSLARESASAPLKVRFPAYQEQNIALEARCSVSLSGLSVKNTECFDVARLQRDGLSTRPVLAMWR